MGSTEGPLVSFCIMCYNQERYIGEALEGAFAQTYRPLEIVISDDASTDRTWDIAMAAVAEYRQRPGSASVVLNRNEVRCGVFRNWLRLCALTKGRLLVKADGDDVSVPERTARIVEGWLKDGCRATVVSHSGWLVGPRGQRLGPMWPVTASAPVGTMMAFDRRTFSAFGDVAADLCVGDDEMLARRALMLGPELVLPDRLVRYRLGTGISTSLWRIREPMCRCRHLLLDNLKQASRDLDSVRDFMTASDLSGWERRLEADRRRVEAELMLFEGHAFSQRVEGFRSMGRSPLLSRRQYLKCAFLMPRPLGNCLLFAYMAVRYIVRRVKGVLGR